MTALAVRVRALRLADVRERRWALPVLLAGIVALSFALRSTQLRQGFWIDEGISVGVARHDWLSIPQVLRQDGSPPAYYMLLGLWIRLFGDGELATHALSLLFALASIPLAYAVGRSVFDRATGVVAAVLVAFTPYLTYYGQETRMYAFEGFLSLLAILAYESGVVRERRPWAVVLVLTLALMVYGHNWALFFCVGLAAATVVYQREHLRRFGLVAVGVAILYLPWLPTLLSQARQTGAPWSTRPSFHELFTAPGAIVGGDTPFVAFVVAAAAGLALSARRTERSLAVAVAVTVVAAWVASQISPAWTTRYFAVVLGPVVLLCAAAVVRGRRVGAVALVAVLFLWWGYSVRDDKENARQIAARLAPSLQPGELVISTHPEQVPVLRYYLGAGPRFATTLGPVADPQVFDWRDAVERLRAKRPRPTLEALLAGVPRGGEFVVVAPVFRDYRAWKAEWTRLVWRRAQRWNALLDADPRLRRERVIATDEIAIRKNYFKPLQAVIYRRLR